MIKRATCSGEIMIDDVDMSVEVVYTFVPACSGTHWQPPEHAEVEILSCKDTKGTEIELSDDNFERLYEQIVQLEEEKHEDAY